MAEHGIMRVADLNKFQSVKEIPVLKVVGVNPLVKLENVNNNGLPAYNLCK